MCVHSPDEFSGRHTFPSEKRFVACMQRVGNNVSAGMDDTHAAQEGEPQSRSEGHLL